VGFDGLLIKQVERHNHGHAVEDDANYSHKTQEYHEKHHRDRDDHSRKLA